MHSYLKRPWVLIAVLICLLSVWGSGHPSTSPRMTGAVQDDPQKKIEEAAKKLHKTASQKFEAETYWQSAVDLIIILDFYATYSKIDEVTYLLGKSLHEMRIYRGAEQVYRYLLKEWPKTRWVPHAILGMQKVKYQTQDYQKSLTFYQALERHYSSQKLIHESRYYAVQAYFHLQNYAIIPTLVEHIDDDTEFYPFAMYTAGLTALKKKACARRLPIFTG